MRTESTEYRGYELQAVHNPPLWQVSIYPTSKNLPFARADQVASRRIKEEAIAEARGWVDELLADLPADRGRTFSN
jgi:hypothetical protein